MSASKRALALAKAEARKAGTLPSRKSIKSFKQVERNWDTPKPRNDKRFAVADLPKGALVLFRGNPCILMDHVWDPTIHSYRATIMNTKGRQFNTHYRYLSLPPS